MFDSNKIAKNGDFPINYQGVPNAGALRYPDLAIKYSSTPIRLSNSSVQGMDAINSNLYGGIVKLTAEVIRSNI